MKHPMLQYIEDTNRRTNITYPAVGSHVRVDYRIKEGEKERVQGFEGTVIRRHQGEKSLDATITVRKISGGVGVERVFPFHSPLIEGIKVLRQGKVRRAKLYYLRSLAGKKARLREVSHNG
ncbi:MAG: 50S ribosomal protein L19 [Deltaproteobacteria bacterium]|nr:50S ribosomal protein L19 [Deltaproteobacteria bacterium]